MKLLLTSLLFITGFFTDPALPHIRRLYERSVGDEWSCRELIRELAPYNDRNNPLLYGYRGGATMIMARHTFNPFIRLGWFRKGRDMLQQAIDRDTANIELRFLRLSAQTNAPSFLGYHDQITGDKAFLLRTFPSVTDSTLRVWIRYYLK